MKILTIHWPTGIKRVLVDDDGNFPEADLLDTVQARLSYLYPHPVNHLVRNVPDADHPKFAEAVSKLVDVFLIAGIHRGDVFWSTPDMASKAAYTAVEKRRGKIWARMAQDAAESFDASCTEKIPVPQAHKVVEAALRALPPLRGLATVCRGIL